MPEFNDENREIFEEEPQVASGRSVKIDWFENDIWNGKTGYVIWEDPEDASDTATVTVRITDFPTEDGFQEVEQNFKRMYVKDIADEAEEDTEHNIEDREEVLTDREKPNYVTDDERPAPESEEEFHESLKESLKENVVADNSDDNNFTITYFDRDGNRVDSDNFDNQEEAIGFFSDLVKDYEEFGCDAVTSLQLKDNKTDRVLQDWQDPSMNESLQDEDDQFDFSDDIYHALKSVIMRYLDKDVTDRDVVHGVDAALIHMEDDEEIPSNFFVLDHEETKEEEPAPKTEEEPLEEAKKDEEEHECCICHKKFKGYGNNPYPVCDDGVCCDDCNWDKVIPARLAGMDRFDIPSDIDFDDEELECEDCREHTDIPDDDEI